MLSMSGAIFRGLFPACFVWTCLSSSEQSGVNRCVVCAVGLPRFLWGLKCQTPEAEPFLRRTRKLPCIFAALFVCYSSRLRLRDSLLRPCYDFLLFFTTQTRPVHRETDSGDEKFITPINKIHNPILGYVKEAMLNTSVHLKTNITIFSF